MEIRPTIPVSLKKADSINGYVKDQAYSWTFVEEKGSNFPSCHCDQSQ